MRIRYPGDPARPVSEVFDDSVGTIKEFNMRLFCAILSFMVGLALVLWLGIWVMLYGGIMQAINNWGVDNGAVVWGIIRAVFFEAAALAGLPFWILAGALLSD